MIQVVYIIPSFQSGGPNNVVLNIIRHLDRGIYSPIIVALHDICNCGDSAKTLFEELGCVIDQMHVKTKDLFTNKRKIALAITQKYADNNTIFHSHCLLPVIITSAMSNVPTVTTIHSIAGEDLTMKYGRLKGGILSWLYKNSLSKISHCVAISEYMADYYRKYTRSISVIYNGVQQQIYNNYEKDSTLIKKNLCIKPGAIVFLYPAVFATGKNHRYLIEAMRLVKRKDVYILFAGSGPTEDECKALAINDDRIKFLGYQKNLDKFWSFADYLISPSLSEGMPMAVLEAVIRGKSCFLSNIRPHIEIVRKLELDDNHIFDVSNCENFAKQIDKVINDSISSEFIKYNAISNFSSEKMSHSYQNLYSQLMSR